MLHAIIIVYIIISFYEWFIHRYIMHGDSESLKKIPLIGGYLSQTAMSHLNHHKDVNINMTLKTSTETGNVQLPWSTIFLFIVLSLIASYKLIPKYHFFVVQVVIFYSFLWNNWHTKFHDYKHDINITSGIPRLHNFFAGGYIYNTLWKYHAIHHSQKGEKYNFNVFCPLFDHVFGTYKSGVCIDNMEYCKKNQDDDRCYQPQYYCYKDKDVLKNK